jgi:uncharacterized protein (TIGR02598 family)
MIVGSPNTMIFRSFPRTHTLRRGFSLVEIVLALGIVTLVMVVLLGLITNILRTLRDSEDDTKLPDLAQQVLQHVRHELSRDAAFTNPNNLAGWHDNQRECFFTADLSPLTVNEAQANPHLVYYRILAELKNPPPAVDGIPPGALKTLLLRMDWPWHSADSVPANTRIYSLLLRNTGYRQWEHTNGVLQGGGWQ